MRTPSGAGGSQRLEGLNGQQLQDIGLCGELVSGDFFLGGGGEYVI